MGTLGGVFTRKDTQYVKDILQDGLLLHMRSQENMSA